MSEINTWPGWECVRLLGAGSFGKVYEIQKIENGRAYKSALKVITIPQNDAEIENAYSEGMDEAAVTEYFKTFVDDFANEFTLMADLRGYTNIVSYEDHMIDMHQGKIGWDILIKMELLTPLLRWTAEHPMSEADVLNLGCDMCRALELCHKNKIIHRDIKPQNIFVNKNGDFKLGDFGIARVVEKTNSSMSQKGTYTYMAPEIFKGTKYDATVDIYSLGIVLYRYLNHNRTPFLPLGNINYHDQQRAQERRMAGELVPAPAMGSDKLKMIVLKMLQYDPKNRIQSASELRRMLEMCKAELESTHEEFSIFSEISTVPEPKAEPMIPEKITQPAVPENQTSANMARVADEDLESTIPVVPDMLIEPTVPVIPDENLERTVPVVPDMEVERTIPVLPNEKAEITVPMKQNVKDEPVALFENKPTNLEPERKAKGKGVYAALCAMVAIVVAAVIWCFSAANGNKEEVEISQKGNSAIEKNTADVIYEKLTEQDLNNVIVGHIYTFGSYEQDNDASNGKEDIEWQVLEKEGTKVLVISKYALDCQPYNMDMEEVTWETCTLRAWLNEDFINQAFSEEEKAMIPTVTVTADTNSSYTTAAGSDTQDKVFILSTLEVNMYYGTNSTIRQCKATCYAEEQGSDVDGGYITWWLRTSGYDQSYASVIESSGNSNDFGYNVDYDANAVRPALWIDLECNIEDSPVDKDEQEQADVDQDNKEDDETNPIEQSQDNVNVGDVITFGSYEQDNNISNGKEAIEWQVLDKDGTKILVISKYALDCQPYNTELEDVTWETCTLRAWLNDEFINIAFTDGEKAMIPTVTVTADENPYYDTDPGNDTQDKIFLLSIEEAEKYFASDAAMMCEATAYAEAQGVYISSSNGNCGWWLRSPGLSPIGAAGVSSDGGVYGEGYYVSDINGAACPALWINLEP